jgi:hypothetical protein
LHTQAQRGRATAERGSRAGSDGSTPSLATRAGFAHDCDAPILALVATAFSFALYASRLCPTLCLAGDSAELVTAAALWGIPHAPGYPIFTTIAHAFTWLPTHDLPWRVHLTSALLHAATVGILVLATFAITRKRAAALAAGVTLALTPSFLVGSLYAEVFPLNDLLFAALLLLALRLRSGEGRPLLFATVAGVAAAHHLMFALAVPTLAILALRPLASGPRSGRHWVGLAASFVAPSLVAWTLILIAAARDPALSWGDVHDLPSLFALVTRSDYGGLLSSVHGAGHGTGLERMIALGRLFARGFGGGFLFVALVGVVVLFRTQRTVGVAIAVAIVMTGPLFAWRNAVATDTDGGLAFFERFFTMCSVALSLAFGAGVAVVEDAALHLRAGKAPRFAGAALLFGWLTLAFIQVHDIDLSGDVRGIAFAHDLVLRTPDRALLLLGGDAPTNAALYVCAVEQRCGERVALAPGSLFLPWAMAQTRRRHPEIAIPWTSGPSLKHTHELASAAATTRAVFVSPDLLAKDPLLAETFAPLPDHLLFRLWPHDADGPAERDALFASAGAIAADEASPDCEGCLLPPPAFHPNQETQLALAYEAAAANHAHAIAPYTNANERNEPNLLLARLLARAGNYAQRGGESMSR